MTDESVVVPWVLGLFNVLLGFLLYLTRDKLKSIKDDYTNLEKEVRFIRERVSVVEVTTLSRKEMDEALKELKLELKNDFTALNKKIDEDKEHQNKIFTELTVQLTQIATLVRGGKREG